MDLYVGPPRKRPWRNLFLIILGLLLAGWFVWRQDWLQASISKVWDRNGGPAGSLPFASSLPQLIGPAGSDAVVLSASNVIDSPQSPAYTDELYQPDANEGQVPWPNAGGRTKVLTYTVQSGDTLWSIATEFELDLDTLLWSNPALEQNPDLLSVGAELIILPVIGAYHRAAPGETLETIAPQYGVTAEDIAGYPPNGLYPPYGLKPGQGLIIPFGRKGGQVAPPPVAGEEGGEVAAAAVAQLAWPVMTDATGEVDAERPALNINAKDGTAVFAADSGQIVSVLKVENAGYNVLIDHGNGLETWYMYLGSVLLPAGSYVNRGDPIGAASSNGDPQGASLRFEVHLNGQPADPRNYLASGEPPQP